jgi:PS-10 peptidase S37
MSWSRRLALAAFALAAAAALAACGDDLALPDAPAGDLLDQIAGLPGVAVTEAPTADPDYRYFKIALDQAVDHDHPGGQRFTQHLTLVVRDPAAPTVLLTTGYGNYYGDYRVELTRLLHANQLIIEHRYFPPSRPEPADWTRLTIEQAAGDHHVVAELFHRILTGPWVSSGASKGGMTSVFHRRWWPDDVVGTVAYVAPISYGAPDDRYDAFLGTVGTAPCRDAVHAAAAEMLANRRAMLESRARDQATANGYQYTRIALGPAVESAVESLYWSFWQYYGADYCSEVPAPAATDDALWQFLDMISPVYSSDDDELAFFEAYDYQAEFQLGFPGWSEPSLDGLLLYGASDYAGADPIGVTPPTFAPGAMLDIRDWVAADGADLVFVYGEWDPWTGGQFELGNARDAIKVIAPAGTHGSGLLDLEPGDRDAAFAMLETWTGVTPDPSAATARRRPPPPRERLPAAVLVRHALRAAERRGVRSGP